MRTSSWSSRLRAFRRRPFHHFCESSLRINACTWFTSSVFTPAILERVDRCDLAGAALLLGSGVSMGLDVVSG